MGDGFDVARNLRLWVLWDQCAYQTFYRAMQYSAKRGLAIACRLAVRPSVCPSVTLVDHDHIG